MISAKDLAAHMSAHADDHEQQATKIDATAKGMTKPGERRTREELQRKSRGLSQLVYHLRNGVRAMKAAGLI